MKQWIFFCAVAGFGLFLEKAHAAVPDNRDAWLFNCRGNSCLVAHSMVNDRFGEAAKIQIIMDFDRAKAKPSVMLLYFPADADPAAGVYFGFTDVPDFGANGEIIHKKEAEAFRIPMEKCDANLCAASIDQGPGDRDLQKLFIDKFAAHEFFVMGYEQKGEPRQFLEPTSMFKRDYQSLMTEMRKPQ